jgi:hypothetical protein
MFFKKSVEAKVLSKNFEELVNPPVFAASSVNSMLGMAAMQDDNKSMWDRATRYYVSFSVGDKTKEFQVERQIYDLLSVGDEGTLVYSGTKFISFE